MERDPGIADDLVESLEITPASKRQVALDTSEGSRKKHKISIPGIEDLTHSESDYLFKDQFNDDTTKVNDTPKSDILTRNSTVLKSITNLIDTELKSSPQKPKYIPNELDELDFDDDIWDDASNSPTPVSMNTTNTIVKPPMPSASTKLSPPSSSSNKFPRSSYNSTTTDHEDLYESISMYQSKLIDIQKTHIALLNDLLKKAYSPNSLNAVDSAKISSFEFEVKQYESCITPLTLQATGGTPLPTPNMTTELPKLRDSDAINPSNLGSVPFTPILQPNHLNGTSINAPVSVLSDDENDEFGEISESLLDYAEDFDSLPVQTTHPQSSRLGSPGIEIVSSDVDVDLDVEEFQSDIEETEAFEHISSSPQGIKMTQLSAANRVTDKEYAWSSDVDRILHQIFKLPGFRCNQLEAINATLMRKDVFVLMPTGGGKSLCYQLPALVQSGSTQGSTVVISPLISLMQDQTFHLKNKGIRAAMLSSKLEREERNNVFGDLYGGNLSLLYVSPEMLNSSGQLRNALKTLSDRNELARIVIDEAHCVSSWGHDFRPDYKLLENLKVDFPNIPIMALTATANERVRLDIFKCLRSDNTTFLKQSFNRANLYYEVQEKSKDVNDVIANLMSTKFRGKSGIIYCHSRASCEKTAQILQNAGLNVTYYHALLSPEERESVQTSWQSGAIQAICATIAFGMGIDKPDVRFVFHLTLPRNMEGYYQETGRAGRDGLPSECILFYHYRDALTLQSMINKDDLEPHIKASHKEMLKRVIQYCQNSTDCRRKQVLQYFNETFDVRKCRGGCDNCRFGQNRVKEIRDVSERAREIIELVSSIQRDNVTLIHCIDVYRGSRGKKILEKGHDRAKNYGVGKNLDRTDVERMFHHLITEGILDEYSRFLAGFSSSYIKRGPEAPRVLSRELPVTMMFNPTSSGKTTSTKNTPSRPMSKETASRPASSRVTPIRNASAMPTPQSTRTTSITRTSTKTFTPTGTRGTSATTASSSFVSHNNYNSSDFEENCYGKLEIKRLQLKNDFSLSKVTDVCSNAALKEMAKILPTDIESFSKIPTVTPLQVENFYMYFRPELVKLKNQKSMIGSASVVTSSSLATNTPVEAYETDDEQALAEAFMDDDDLDADYQDEVTSSIPEPRVEAESPYFSPTATRQSRRSSSRSSSTFTSRVRGGGSGSTSTFGGGFRRGGGRGNARAGSRSRGGGRGGSRARSSTSKGSGGFQSKLTSSSSFAKMMPM